VHHQYRLLLYLIPPCYFALYDGALLQRIVCVSSAQVAFFQAGHALMLSQHNAAHERQLQSLRGFRHFFNLPTAGCSPPASAGPDFSSLGVWCLWFQCCSLCTCCKRFDSAAPVVPIAEPSSPTIPSSSPTGCGSHLCRQHSLAPQSWNQAVLCGGLCLPCSL